MGHRKAGRKLNRTASHRRSLFANLSASLIKHETLRTTLAKARGLRRVGEPVMTRAGNDSVASRRRAFSALRDKEAVGKLFDELGPHYRERPGGYLRILKHGFRKGDNAPMGHVSLVDREPPETADEES